MIKRLGLEEYYRLLSYLKKYRRDFILASFGMVVVSATAGTSAWLIQPMLDDIFVQKNRQMLVMLTFGLVALYLVRGFFRYFSSVEMKKIGNCSVNDIRFDLYKHIQGLSLSFFQKHTTGKLISRITSDLTLIQGSVSVSLYDLIKESLTVVVLVGVLIYRDATLALIALVTIPFFAVLIARIGKRLRTVYRNIQENMADLTSVMSETFSGYRVVQSFGMQEYEIRRFDRENKAYLASTLKGVRTYELSSPIMEFLGVTGLALILWYGGNQVIDGGMTVGEFFSFLTALFMLFAPLTRLSQLYNNLQAAAAAATRIFEVMDTPPSVTNAPDAIDIPAPKKEIRFEQVGFKYGNEPILQDISFSAKAGSQVALVGMSGAGKSTLVDLIPRFYDPAEGRILIDGVDIRNAAIESLRNHIGIVSQDVFLFNDTIFNNIAYGRHDTPMEKVLEASQQAYAHDFIASLPEGYDTVVGERGVKLSGGQRQRIAIARAILKNPAILIMDEATSALDTESEIVIQKALDNLTGNRTTFVIAHRLSTILHADEILVLENGRIVERGTHHDLLARDGSYRKVFDLQFRRGEING